MADNNQLAVLGKWNVAAVLTADINLPSSDAMDIDGRYDEQESPETTEALAREREERARGEAAAHLKRLSYASEYT